MTEQMVEQQPDDDQPIEREEMIDAIAAMAEEREWDTGAGFEAMISLAVSLFFTAAQEEGMGEEETREGFHARAEELLDAVFALDEEPHMH